MTSYELFSDTEILGRIAPRRMLAGLSTRRYPVPVALEPIGARADRDVALRGVPAACGQAALAQLHAGDLSSS